MRRRTLLQGLGALTGLSLAPGAWGQGVKPGRWLRLESPTFVVYSTAEEDKSRQELAALEAYNTLLSRLMPRNKRSSLKLTVYMAGTTRDFDMIWPGGNDGIGGFYSANIEEVFAATAVKKALERQRDMQKNVRAMDARVILFHEYAHHFIRANNRVAYPTWYNEGFPEFLSTADFNDQGVDIGKFTANRASWLYNGDWLKIETFLTKHPFELSSEDTAMFYAQAWLATHYMFERPERAQGFDRYVAALQKGGDSIASFEPAFGITHTAFDKELRDYKRKPIQFWSMLGVKPDPSAITVQRLAASADDLLLSAAYLRRLPSPKYAKDTVARIREQAKKYPDDIFARQTLAQAEVWYGDLGEARRQLDKLVADAPGNADVHHLSGLCNLRAGRDGADKSVLVAAEDSFGRAYQLDKTRVNSMFRYVETGLARTGSIDEHFINVLVGAYQLAPQIDPLALTTAQALIQHKRYEEAELVLRPLTAELHGGNTPEIAKALMGLARTKAEAPFTFFGVAEVGSDDDKT